MQKLIGAALLLCIIATLNSKAFAASLNCTVKAGAVSGIKSLHISEDAFVINDQVVVELEHSRIKCGNLGRQDRFDGVGDGFQVILKSCTNGSVLEGHIIDSRQAQVADIVCD